MSREIRFRGWDTRQKVMYSAEEMGQDQLTLSVDGRGFINVSGDSTMLSTFATQIIPMQYTGLKDKNGVEIYEDDIVKTQHGNYPVGWLVHQARFAAQYGQVYVKPECWDRHEVIGDIHQDPKLLEGK